MHTGENWRFGDLDGVDGLRGTATIEPATSTARVAVVMPAYNEEALQEFMVEIESALQPVTASLRFVVVDDASTTVRPDVTRLPLGARVRVIRNETNRGHGPSALRAYAAGLADAPDLVFHVDGDGQFVGSDFVALLGSVADCDGVVGVRAARAEPWFRRVLTFGAKVLTGFRGADPNSPLRVYRAAALRQLIESLDADSVVPHLHFTFLHQDLGLNVAEVLVTHQPRRGVSSVGTSWQGSVPVLPSGRLVRLAARAVLELVQRRLRVNGR